MPEEEKVVSTKHKVINILSVQLELNRKNPKTHTFDTYIWSNFLNKILLNQSRQMEGNFKRVEMSSKNYTFG